MNLIINITVKPTQLRDHPLMMSDFLGVGQNWIRGVGSLSKIGLFWPFHKMYTFLTHKMGKKWQTLEIFVPIFVGEKGSEGQDLTS